MSRDKCSLACKNGYLCKLFSSDKGHTAVVGQSCKIRSLLETIQHGEGGAVVEGGGMGLGAGGVLTKMSILERVVQQQEFLLSSFLLFASGDVLVSGFSIKPNVLNNVTIKHGRLCPCW